MATEDEMRSARELFGDLLVVAPGDDDTDLVAAIADRLSNARTTQAQARAAADAAAQAAATTTLRGRVNSHLAEVTPRGLPRPEPKRARRARPGKTLAEFVHERLLEGYGEGPDDEVTR